MEYTFASSIEDGFSVVYAPINYLGASNQLKWHVSYVNGKANAVLLDEEDYAIIDKNIYFIDRTYTSLDTLKAILNDLFNKANITVEADKSGRFILYSSEPFTITFMTTRLKYALGLYYLNDINISGVEQFNEGELIYIFRCGAVHFNYLTPIWYVISNMGTPTQISSLIDRYRLYYPAINVKVINTFTESQPLCISNCEYFSISQASSLSNLRFQIVDSDMNPIKFLTPIYITISVEPVTEDEQIQEAMAEQEQNPNFVKMFQEYMKKNTELIETLLAKTERGITVEPEIPPMDEQPQYNQPVIENKPCETDEGVTNIDSYGISISNEVVYSELFGEGNDDKTEEKETGIEQQEEHNISEEAIRIQEQDSRIE